MPGLVVVEEDADLRAALVSVLEDEGYVVRAVADAATAARICEEQTPDLLIADLPPWELERFLEMKVRVVVFSTWREPAPRKTPGVLVFRAPLEIDPLLDYLASVVPRPALAKCGDSARAEVSGSVEGTLGAPGGKR